MAITLNKTQCCAIQEISGLFCHNPHQALISFCQQNFSEGKVKFGGTTAKPDQLYSFYLFTAALGKYDKPYGRDFADLIQTEKLGEVWASPQLTNLAFHPDHKNQVWIWMPDAKALKAWWEKNNPTKPKPPLPTVKGFNVPAAPPVLTKPAPVEKPAATQVLFVAAPVYRYNPQVPEPPPRPAHNYLIQAAQADEYRDYIKRILPDDIVLDEDDDDYDNDDIF